MFSTPYSNPPCAPTPKILFCGVEIASLAGVTWACMCPESAAEVV